MEVALLQDFFVMLTDKAVVCFLSFICCLRVKTGAKEKQSYPFWWVILKLTRKNGRKRAQ